MHHLILGFKSQEHDYFRILKVSDIQANAKLAQYDKYQTGIYDNKSPLFNPHLMPILPISSSLWKTQNGNADAQIKAKYNYELAAFLET